MSRKGVAEVEVTGDDEIDIVSGVFVGSGDDEDGDSERFEGICISFQFEG